MSDLKDAETGTRGYLLTGDSDFLQPYLKAKDVIIKDVDKLTSLSTDNTDQLKQVRQLQQLSHRRLEICQVVQQKRAATDFNVLTVAADLHHGKEVMDSIRGIVSSVQQKETDLLTPEINVERDQ